MFGSRGGARGQRQDAAHTLYLSAVAQARAEAFFTRCGVPDSVDGRFETIALHVFLLLRRLKDQGPEAAALSQALFDTMFADMDRNLREMGAGDLGVGKRVKAMAEGFYGRVKAYDAALTAGDGGALDAALGRNLYGTTEPAPAHTTAVAAYMRREAEAIDRRELAALLAGEVAFGPPPEPA